MLGVKAVSEVSPCATQEFTKKSHKKEKVLASVVELQSHTVRLRLDGGLLVSQKLKTTAIGPIILKPKKIRYMGTLS